MVSTPLVRQLRRDQTPAERRFWRLLYPFRNVGHHIRRQSPIGDYIVDFVHKRDRLIFEIDGDSHYSDGAELNDVLRTAYLAGRGYRVVRFTNLEILGNPNGVYSELIRLLGDPTHPPRCRG